MVILLSMILEEERQGSWLPGWAAQLARYGPLLLVALIVAALLRTLIRHRRYDASSVLGPESRAAVRDALAAAEKRSEGEIVPVVLERSDRHPEACWLAALAALLLASVLLVSWLPWQRPALILSCQIGAGAVGWLLARLLPDLRRTFVSEARATEVAEEQAVQEFHRARLYKTRRATGVLLFVSLLERRVIVLGDEGIHAKVGDDHWKSTTQAVLDGIAAGSLRSGLLAGIERCGAVLAEHFPAQRHDVNELPDRLIVRRE
jgi:putative membrane protein